MNAVLLRSDGARSMLLPTMIFKELDPFRGNPCDVDARLEADKLAYYLRRFYRRSHAVDVLNGLHVQSGQSTARIDHLLMHAHGLLVLLREPTRGRMQVSLDGNWLCWAAGTWRQLRSPITHAYVQALLLKSLLDLRVKQKGFFDGLELDVLVVLDDSCELQWPDSGSLVEVCKREEVFERCEYRFAQCASQALRPGALTQTERQTLGEFLCLAHRALAYGASAW